MPTLLSNLVPVGFRKFSLTLLVFTVSVLLLLKGKITSDNWVSLNQIIIPAFLAVNIVSKMIGTKGNDKSNSE